MAATIDGNEPQKPAAVVAGLEKGAMGGEPLVVRSNVGAQVNSAET